MCIFHVRHSKISLYIISMQGVEYGPINDCAIIMNVTIIKIVTMIISPQTVGEF